MVGYSIPQTADVFIGISYLVIEIRPELGATPGGSGSARIRLSALPQWLSERPGTMIVAIQVI